MSEPTDREWEAAEDQRLNSDVWDWYEQQRIEQEARDDRTARIVLTIVLILLFVAVMVAAQTEMG